MDLLAAKKAAEEVLAGKDAEDWRGEAQTQAKSVLGIVGLVAEAKAEYEALKSTLNSELASLQAQKFNVPVLEARAKAAEAEVARLKDALAAAEEKFARLDQEAAARVEAAVAQLKELF